MKEQWKPIPGHKGYKASNLGNILSVRRPVNNNGGTRWMPDRVLSQWTVKSTGYKQVDLSGQRVSVHRAVALAWCDGYFTGATVDHINGVRSDNRAENLEWVTQSENIKRSFKSGRKNPFLGKFSANHPTSKSVISTCRKTGDVLFWNSAMDAVRAGFDSSSISRCCTGKSQSHKGHEWRFAEYGDRHGVRWSEPHPDERASA